ncbi:MAG: hypothetical protein Q7V58_07245 [Actinomycetota bacterium]|nr:hypothetical protein [Actinomycetota bacterium]
MNPSEPWDTKMARAEEHIAELEAAVQQYMDDAQPKLAWTIDEPDGCYAARLTVPFDPPARLGAIVGDVVHSLRSALEARMFRILSERATTTSLPKPPKPRRYAYPVEESRAELEAGDWHQGLGDKGLFDVLEVSQPFAYLDDGSEPVSDSYRKESIAMHPLTVLHKSWNFDKHNAIHVALCAVHSAWLEKPEGVEIDYLLGDPPPWSDGGVFMRARVTAGDPKDVLTSGGKVVVALAEELGDPSAGYRPTEVVGRMRILQAHVYEALARLRGF